MNAPDETEEDWDEIADDESEWGEPTVVFPPQAPQRCRGQLSSRFRAMTTPPHRLLNMREAAEYCGNVTDRYLRNLAKAGQLPGAKRVGRKWTIQHPPPRRVDGLGPESDYSGVRLSANLTRRPTLRPTMARYSSSSCIPRSSRALVSMSR